MYTMSSFRGVAHRTNFYINVLTHVNENSVWLRGGKLVFLYEFHLGPTRDQGQSMCEV